MNNDFDFIVVGAGIVGLSVARELSQRFNSARICIIEKESSAAQHASGRNSGVLHSGFYYTAESLKAKLTAEGNRSLRQYCENREIPINKCGKVVVASDESEISGVKELLRRGRVNGINISEIDEKQLTELEPNAKTCSIAIWSPTTAVIDPEIVCKYIVKELEERKVNIQYNTAFIAQGENRYIRTSAGRMNYRTLINAAGLYADKVAHCFGVGREFTLIPFKGFYFEYHDSHLIKRHVYPVPNLDNPFLGIHFTKCVDGHVKVGPTATPAFYRESYQFPHGLNIFEMLEIGLWDARLFIGNNFNFRKLALSEMKRYWKREFIRQAKRMLPSADAKNFGGRVRPGIRAQLLNKKEKRLELDFVIKRGEGSVHVLNAVSPAFTCAFPFAKLVVDEVNQ